MSKQLNKQTQGFTIIEVLIVLAIAGVIMLVVFLAVPALQRNSRNTQRKADVSHLAGVTSEWISNNAGKTVTAWDGTNGPDLTKESFALITNPPAAPADETAVLAPAAASNVDTPIVYYGATCNGTALVGKQGKRSMAISYLVETAGGGAASAQCLAI